MFPRGRDRHFRRNLDCEKAYVIMKKKDGELLELFPTIFGGWAICWEILKNVPFTPGSSIMFDDDKKWKESDYTFLGEL